MASQTMRSSKAENPFAPPPMQAHLAKVKQEDEEELWISGEELYTEGSSDEEDYRPGARNRRRTNNASSRSSSTNPSSEQHAHSAISTDKTNSENHVTSTKQEHKSVAALVAKSETAVMTNKSNSKATVLPGRTSIPKNSKQSPSTGKQNDGANSKEKPMADLNDEQETDEKISWKVNRGTFVLPSANDDTDKFQLCKQECTSITLKGLKDVQLGKVELDSDRRLNGLFGNAWFEHLEMEGEPLKLTGKSEEQMNNEISKMRNLDKIICELNNKVKEATEEMLINQYENRKRLESLLSVSPPEIGALAENTKQFFHLCPKYILANYIKNAQCFQK